MHMVGHEHIGVQVTFVSGQLLPEDPEVQDTIGIAVKTGLAVVSALDKVSWKTGRINAR